MSGIIRLSLGLALSAFLVGPAAAGPKVAALGSKCAGFAIDPHTGALLGLDPAGGTATLYSRAYVRGEASAEAPIRVDLPGKPFWAACKKLDTGRCFVVACREDSRLHVLDTATLRTVKTVKISADGVAFAASSPAGSLVFYTAERSQAAIGRVDVADGEDDGLVPCTGPFADSGMEIAVSADSRYLYARGVRGSPSGFQCFALARGEEGRPAWKHVHYDHDTRPMYIPDPFGQCVASGRDLYTPDLRRRRASLEQSPRCFFPDRPVVIATGGKHLFALSYNDHKAFGSMALPEEITAAVERNNLWGRGSRPAFLPDPQADQVVIAFGDRVLAVGLRDLAVEPEPLLVADVAGPRRWVVGHPVRIALEPRDPRCSIALDDPPDGMKLDGGAVVWTPTSDSVGPLELTMRLSHGSTRRRQKLAVQVVQPQVNLGFGVTTMAINPSGTKAVVAGAGGGVPGFHPHAGQGDGPTQIAVVDLETLEVEARKAMPIGVSVLTVDDAHVYIAPAMADRIDVLSMKDLRRKRRTLTTGSVTGLRVLGGRLLWVSTSSESVLLSLPELKKTRHPIADGRPGSEMAHAHGMMAHSRPDDAFGLTKLPDGLYAAGCLWSDRFELVTFLDCSLLPRLGEAVDPYRRNMGMEVLPSPMPWDRLAMGRMLINAAGQRIGQLPEGTQMILSDHPVAVVASTGTRYDSYGERIEVTTTLALHELVAGQVKQRVTLRKETLSRSEVSTEGHLLLAALGRRVFVVQGDRLMAYTLTDADLALFEPPFSFRRFDEVLKLLPDDETRIEPAVRGGTKPIEYDLAEAREGVSIDPKTGVVTLNGPMLQTAALRQLLTDMLGGADFDPHRRGHMEGHANAKARIREIRSTYRELTRTAPKGIPVLVDVGLVAVDATQAKAAMNAQVVVEVPEKSFAAAMEQVEAQRKAAEAQMRREEEQRERRYREEAERRRREHERRGGAGDAQTRERIRRLEERIDALEAKIDLLTELLRDKQVEEER